MQNKVNDNEQKNQENPSLNIILTLGETHYVLPIKSYRHNRGDDVTGVTLIDDSRLETSSNNIAILFGESDFINAILESSEEKFYQPEQTKRGKIMLKRINKDTPFKQFGGKENE